MNIERLSQEDGAGKARGITVIIDVFRAFTCEPFMYHYGAESIFLEADIETCRTFAGKALLVGERDGREIEGFDLGNSPSVILSKGRGFFEGRTVIHRTTSGVTGALAALEHSDEVLLASYVSARPTARYILNRKPALVSIVAMGVVSVQRTLEDEYCGDYIESLLTGKPYDHVKALGDILSDETAQKFLRGDRTYYPREDAVICLQRDLFDFALCAERRDGLVAAVKKLP
ncbi:2-phosphosulfolactate phosphatase [bacterium]|nr:2-phosphosulfolactate phosphatase [bacterium]